MWRIFAGIVGLVLWVSSGNAIPVKGVLHLPAHFRHRPLFRAPGFWRLENRVLDISNPALDPRQSMALALEGAAPGKNDNPSPILTMEDARFVPQLLTVPVGTRVQFANMDSVIHLVETLGQPRIPARSLGPTDTFEHLFAQPGVYRMHCAEVPHMHATILVTQYRQVAVPDGTGTFHFADVAPGTYMLKVWYGGKWIHSQPINIVANRIFDIKLPESINGAGAN